MRRREVIGLIGGAAALPLGVRAQQPKKLPRIGFMATGFQGRMIDAFRQGLEELGYLEVTNFVVAAHIWLMRFVVPKWSAWRAASTWSRNERQRFIR